MHIGEACLPIANALPIADMVSRGLKQHCRSWSRMDLNYIFDLPSARTIIRAEPDILWMRVEADDVDICHGVKALLEAELWNYTRDMPTNLLWLEARGEPFSTIMSHQQSGGVTGC